MGIAPACACLGLSRASLYRAEQPQRHLYPSKPRPASPRALSSPERQSLLATLDSERFIDMAPAAIYAILLEEGQYLGSVRTMYRVLKQENQIQQRRCQRRHPLYSKPELLATAPNQVWSWDITKLKGAHTWSIFHLYVILDIFSRYVVGWMIAPQESATLAEKLIAETAAKQHIQPGTLTLHADRGASMRSASVAQLLTALHITKTHSRPHVSDDNPCSESQFKTLKYRPDFPARFAGLEEARLHCQHFFRWYNQQHRHSGIGLMSPHAVHYGQAAAVQQRRALTLQNAFHDHPLRFRAGLPKPPALPTAVWINPPPNNLPPCPSPQDSSLNAHKALSHRR